ncbi:MAG: hypothetical protein AB1498_08925 [bacterium]
MNDVHESPYLSIVTSSRNDDHGGNMFKRTQTTLSSVIGQLEKYKLKSEVILTDYNPPSHKPLLKDVLCWPEETKYCTIRYLVVPSSIHTRFKDSDKTPYNFSVAQNAGLKRARGKFVLMTSIDILFSDELIEFVAKEILEADKIYRTDRQDVNRNILEVSSADLLEFCRKNVIWIHTRNISIPVVRKKKQHLRSRNLDINAGNRDFPNLHLNGADLLLMSRESWHSLRGFPERDNLGLGVEILLCNMAYLKGIKEEMLPDECCIYHIDHDSRWRSTIPGLCDKILFYCFSDKLASCLMFFIGALKLGELKSKLTPKTLKEKNKDKKPEISSGCYKEYWEAIDEMKDGKRQIVYNGNDWGLGAEELEQYVIRRAEWDAYAKEIRDCSDTAWLDV